MDRWNTRRQQPKATNHDSGTTSGASGSNVTGDDPFLLDFGTSVNVNEDLRREIRAEILDLDEKMASTRNDLKKEETVEATLNSTSSSCHREMFDYSRKVSEQLDTTSVFFNIANDHQKTLRDEFAVYTPPHPVTPGTSNLNPPYVTDDESTANPVLSNQDVLRGLSDRFEKTTSSMKAEEREIDRVVEEKKAVKAKTTMTLERMENDDLPAQLDTKRQEDKLVQAEIDKENTRKKATNAATQKSRVKSGEYAQIVADKTPELDRMKRDNLLLETDAADQVKLALAKLSERQTSKAEKELQLAESSSQLAYCKEVEGEIDAFKKAYTEESLGSKQNLSSKEKLELAKAEMVSKVQAAKKELEAKKMEYESARKAAEDTEALRADNDKLEKSLVAHEGDEEMSLLIKEKEKAVKIISEGHEETTKSRENEHEEEAGNRNELKAAMVILGTAKEDLDARLQKKKHLDRVREESKENLEREIRDSVEVEKKYRLAYEAESKHSEDLYQTKKKALDAQFEKMDLKSKLNCKGADRRFNILSSVVEVVEYAEETEYRLNNDPISIV